MSDSIIVVISHSSGVPINKKKKKRNAIVFSLPIALYTIITQRLRCSYSVLKHDVKIFRRKNLTVSRE